MERLPASSAAPNLRAGFLPRAFAGLLALIVLALLAVAGPASAANIHPSENWGFGKDGTSKTDFQEEIFSGEQYGEIEQIHINQATHQLLAIWQPGFESKRMSIFEIGGPESMTPRGGNFPQPISGFCCWRVAMDESNTATAGRIYISSLFAEEGPTIYTPDGEPVSGINFAPESGFKGGVAVDQEGNIFLVNRPRSRSKSSSPSAVPRSGSFSCRRKLPPTNPERSSTTS